MFRLLSKCSLIAAIATAGSPSLQATSHGQSVRVATQTICLPDGRRLGYAEYGDPDGRIVLYFHGTPGTRLDPFVVSDRLVGTGLRVVAVDRPGLGRSSYQSGRRITDWPSDVRCLLESLGCGEDAVGIIAHSGGAPYALACARAMPERITHIAIVSGHTPPGVGVKEGRYDGLLRLVVRRPRISKAAFNLTARRLRRRPDAVIRRITSDWAAADRRLVYCQPGFKQALVDDLCEATRCGAAGILRDAQLLSSCWGFAVKDAAGVPASIWHGCCDPIAPPSMAHYFHAQLPGSELILDPQAGHVSMLYTHLEEIALRF